MEVSVQYLNLQSQCQAFYVLLFVSADAGKALNHNQTADQDAKCYYKCYLQELNWVSYNWGVII